MHEFFFANYRLLVDDGIANHESVKRLANFVNPMPYSHTFTVRLGDAKELAEKRACALCYPVVVETDYFAVHDMGDGWAFLSNPAEKRSAVKGMLRIVLCSRDYGDMTVYVENKTYYSEKLKQYRHAPIPLSSYIRSACEAGMVTRGGIAFHASFVEKDGFGVVFLGPSGMGKSTQAKLWEKYLGADFIIGDRPGFRKINGQWMGFGMPWDGQDDLFRQAFAPVRAMVWLEQAKENSIVLLNPKQAMTVILRQAMMPVWDDLSMNGAVAQIGELAREMPIYHLRCRPNEAAVRLTYEKILSQTSP